MRTVIHLRARALIAYFVLITVLVSSLAGGAAYGVSASPSSEWVFVPSPNGNGATNRFVSVSALAPDDVWAVGESTAWTLTAHWDGTQWTHVPSPNYGTIWSNLAGVAAVAPNDVWAVGYYVVAGGQPQTLAMRWNGSVWNIVPSPYVYGGTSFSAVAAISADDIWAVGNGVVGAPGPTTGTLTAHWNGSSWTIIPSPNVGSRSHNLYAVKAFSSNEVWAVGYSRSVGSNYQPLVLRWNGSSWSVVNLPTISGDAELYAVDGVASNDLWVTGSYSDGAGYHPLFLHWDGSSWTNVPSPGGGRGLAAIASNDVWATGGTFAHWDGVSWSLVPGAQPPGGSNVSPLALGLVSSSEIWAVGSYNNGSATVTLTERWYGGAPAATPTPTAAAATSTPTTAVASSTPVSTSTATPPPPPATGTPTVAATETGVATATSAATSTAVATPTTCSVAFSDVPPDNTFYPYVQCLACREILGGYNDGTFRPYNEVTRGQLSKIVANAAGFNEPVSGQTFSDVPPSHTFYEYIERMAARSIIGGYEDGTFRPGNNATRGQISKIVANAADFTEPVSGQTFTDVPPSHTFYEFIERLAGRGIIGGYNDGTFRPGNSATRGQVSKIVANTFFPECGAPSSGWR